MYYYSFAILTLLAALHNASPVLWCMVPALAVAMLLIEAIAHILFDSWQMRACLRYLNEFSASPLHLYAPADFYDKETLAQVMPILTPRDQRDCWVHVFVVSRANDGKRPSALYSFARTIGSALMFVRDPPSRITSLGKLLMAHELGHVSREGMMHSSYVVRAFVCVVIPVSAHVMAFGRGPVACLLLIVWVAFSVAVMLNPFRFFSSELLADAFAVRLCSPDVIAQAGKLFERTVASHAANTMPSGRSWVQTRVRRLHANCVLALSGEAASVDVDHGRYLLIWPTALLLVMLLPLAWVCPPPSAGEHVWFITRFAAVTLVVKVLAGRKAASLSARLKQRIERQLVEDCRSAEPT